MLKKVTLLLFSAVLIVSCSRGNAVVSEGSAMPSVSGSVYSLEKPENLSDSFSYVFGYMLASSAGVYRDGIDYNYVARGVLDYAAASPFFSSDEMTGIASEYQRKAMARMQERFSSVSASNLQDAESFLEVNSQRPGVSTTSSGLQYEMLSKGEGDAVDPDSIVAVHYRLTLLDGTLADSSYERGVPTEIDLADMLPGIREGISMMNVGDSYRFWVPPELGYGDDPPSGIGPNSLLIFDVELLDATESEQQ